jgi:hypothetical protein
MKCDKNKPKNKPQHSRDDTDELNYIFSDDEEPSSKFQLYHSKNKHVPIRKIHKKSDIENLLIDKDLLEKVNDEMKTRSKNNTRPSKKNGVDSDDNIVLSSSSCDETINRLKKISSNSSNKENINESSFNSNDDKSAQDNKKSNKIDSDGDENIPLSRLKDKNNKEMITDSNLMSSNNRSYSETDDDNSFEDEYAFSESFNDNKGKKNKWCFCECYDHKDSFMCDVCSKWYHKNCFLTTRPLSQKIIEEIEEIDKGVCCYCNDESDMIKKYADALRSRGLNISSDDLDNQTIEETKKDNQSKVFQKTKTKRNSFTSSSESDNDTNACQNYDNAQSIIRIKPFKPKFLNKKSQPETTSKIDSSRKDPASSLSTKISNNVPTTSAQAVAKEYTNKFFSDQNSTKKTVTTSASHETSHSSIKNSSVPKQKLNQIRISENLPEKRAHIKSNNTISAITKTITPIQNSSSATTTSSIIKISNNINDIRSSLRDKLTNALINKKDSDLNSNDLNITNEQIKELVNKIEEEVFKMYPINTGDKYKKKIIAIITNVKDAKNHTFYRKVLNGTIKPFELAKMESKDMASDDVIEERNRQKKEEAKSLTNFFENAQKEGPPKYLKKTKAGDFYVEQESRDFACNSTNNNDQEDNNNNSDSHRNNNSKESTQQHPNKSAAPSLIDKLLQLQSNTLSQIDPSKKINPTIESNQNSKNTTQQPTTSKVFENKTTSLEKIDSSKDNSTKRQVNLTEDVILPANKASKLTESVNEPLKSPPRPHTPPPPLQQQCLMASTSLETETREHITLSETYDLDKFSSEYIPPVSPVSSPDKKNKSADLLIWNGFIDNLRHIGYRTKPYVEGKFILYDKQRRELTNLSFPYRISHEFLKYEKDLIIEESIKKNVYSEIEKIIKDGNREYCFVQFDSTSSGKSLHIPGLRKEIKSCDDLESYENLYLAFQLQNKDASRNVQWITSVKIPGRYKNWIEKIYLFPLNNKDDPNEQMNLQEKYKCPIIRDKKRVYGFFASKPIENKQPSIPVSSLDENISLSSSSSKNSITDTTNDPNLKKRKPNEDSQDSSESKKQKVDTENETINIQQPVPAQQQQPQISKSRDPRLRKNLLTQSEASNKSNELNEPSMPTKQSDSSLSSSSSTISISRIDNLTPSTSQEQAISNILNTILTETKVKLNETKSNDNTNNQQ